jgi:hypothetical protein
MAGNNSSEIRVAGSGRILVADVGKAAPADCTTSWSTDWKDLGYTSTDGITFSKKDKLDPIETWQSLSPARFVYESRDLSLKFSLLQFNEDTLPFFMGGGTGVAPVAGAVGTYSYEVQGNQQVSERALGLEFTDAGSVVYRFVIPRGLVTASDDIKLVRKAAAMLGVTFTAVSSGDSTPLATFLMKDPAYGTV